MIKRIFSVLFTAAVIIGLALVAVLVISAALLGMGAVLSRFFDVTLFQATVVAMVVASAFLYVFMRGSARLEREEAWEYEDEDWEDEDWEDEDWEDEDWEEPEPESPRITRLRPVSSPQLSFENVRRNDPCPCGSGKKYKHCHGKKRL